MNSTNPSKGGVPIPKTILRGLYGGLVDSKFAIDVNDLQNVSTFRSSRSLKIAVA